MDQKTFRTVVIAVVATLAVVGGGWFAWSEWTDHKRTERTAEVAGWVKDSMQEKFNDDADLKTYGLHVVSVDLIRESDTKYTGMAWVNTKHNSLARQVKIDVTADGQNVIWESPPGAFMWLAQEARSETTTAPTPGWGTPAN